MEGDNPRSEAARSRRHTQISAARIRTSEGTVWVVQDLWDRNVVVLGLTVTERRMIVEAFQEALYDAAQQGYYPESEARRYLGWLSAHLLMTIVRMGQAKWGTRSRPQKPPRTKRGNPRLPLLERHPRALIPPAMWDKDLPRQISLFMRQNLKELMSPSLVVPSHLVVRRLMVKVASHLGRTLEPAELDKLVAQYRQSAVVNCRGMRFTARAIRAVVDYYSLGVPHEHEKIRGYLVCAYRVARILELMDDQDGVWLELHWAKGKHALRGSAKEPKAEPHKANWRYLKVVHLTPPTGRGWVDQTAEQQGSRESPWDETSADAAEDGDEEY